MKSYKDLGNKYIKHRKKRAALVVVSMVLTTILIYIVSTIGVNLYTGFSDQVEEQYNFEAQIMETNKEQREKIKNYSTVKEVDFAHYEEAAWFKDCHVDENIPVYYLDSFDQNTFNFNIIEGKAPTNSNEILIYENHTHMFKKDIKVGSSVTIEFCDVGTWEVVKEETFTVTGIYNYENDILLGSTTSSFSLGSDDMNMIAYIKFNYSGDWEKSVSTLAKDVGIDINQRGAYYVNEQMEVVSFRGLARVYIAMFLMIIVFVVYTTMVMIRSLFTSNLNDNITEFSILKAIGATEKKIRAIFKREIYLEGLVAFLLGVLVSQVIFVFLDKVINMYGIDFSFSPIAVIVALLVLYITISLAVMEPFSVLKKVPIVEGIKANYAINKMKDKKRKGKLFRIFGVEGEYAYKNIRRNSKSFWNGVASFTISTLLLTIMVTAMVNLGSVVDITSGYSVAEYDYYTFMDSCDADEEELSAIKNTFLGTGFISKADAYYSYFYVLDDGKGVLPYNDDINNPNVRASFNSKNTSASVVLYDREQLELLNACMEDGVDATVIENGGVIVMGSCTYYDVDTEEMNSIKVVDASVGDKVKVLSADEAVKRTIDEDSKWVFTEDSLFEELEIKGFCSKTLLPDNFNITIIMSYDYVSEKYGMDLSSLCTGFFLKASEDYNISDEVELSRIVYTSAKQSGYEFFNEMIWIERQLYSYKIIIYGIVIFVLLMGIVSILNNMVNEYQVRRREVSVLRAIGMSKKKLNKMLILEKIIMGLIAWLIGVVLGYILTRVIFISILYMYGSSFIVPWLMYLLIGVGVIGIMILISLCSVVSMGKMDITEGIRNQE